MISTALSPPPPLTAQEFPSRLVLTDLRVLIVRMMQAPRDDRLDSPFRICFGLLTYLLTHLLTYSLTTYLLWRYVLGDALPVTMQLLLTRMLPAYASPVLTTPMLMRYTHYHAYSYNFLCYD